MKEISAGNKHLTCDNYNLTFINNTNKSNLVLNTHSSLSKEQPTQSKSKHHVHFIRYVHNTKKPLKLSFKVSDIPNLPLKFQTYKHIKEEHTAITPAKKVKVSFKKYHIPNLPEHLKQKEGID